MAHPPRPDGPARRLLDRPPGASPRRAGHRDEQADATAGGGRRSRPYFLGLPRQHTRGSALLGFVKDDAAYLAGAVAAHAGTGRPTGAPGGPAGDPGENTGTTHPAREAPSPAQPGSSAMTTPTIISCTLDIGGMTCASCVRRVEKVLAKLDGVSSWPRSTSPPRPPPSSTTRPGRPGPAGRRHRHRRLHRPAAPRPDGHRAGRRGAAAGDRPRPTTGGRSTTGRATPSSPTSSASGRSAWPPAWR